MYSMQSCALRVVVLFALVFGYGACASSAKSKMIKISTQYKPQSPSVLEGEPLYSPEIASDLAELTLAEMGIDCRGLQRRLTFFEGCYYVSYYSSETLPHKDTLTVQIDSSSSKVVNVIRTQYKQATTSQG